MACQIAMLKETAGMARMNLSSPTKPACHMYSFDWPNVSANMAQKHVSCLAAQNKHKLIPGLEPSLPLCLLPKLDQSILGHKGGTCQPGRVKLNSRTKLTYICRYAEPISSWSLRKRLAPEPCSRSALVNLTSSREEDRMTNRSSSSSRSWSRSVKVNVPGATGSNQRSEREDDESNDDLASFLVRQGSRQGISGEEVKEQVPRSQGRVEGNGPEPQGLGHSDCNGQAELREDQRRVRIGTSQARPSNVSVQIQTTAHPQDGQLSFAHARDGLAADRKTFEEEDLAKASASNRGADGGGREAKKTKQMRRGKEKLGPMTRIQVAREKWIPCSKVDLMRVLRHGFSTEDAARDFVTVCTRVEAIIHAEHRGVLEELRLDYSLTSAPSPELGTPAPATVLAHLRSATKALTSGTSKALAAAASLALRAAGARPGVKGGAIRLDLRGVRRLVKKPLRKVTERVPRDQFLTESVSSNRQVGMASRRIEGGREGGDSGAGGGVQGSELREGGGRGGGSWDMPLEEGQATPQSTSRLVRENVELGNARDQARPRLGLVRAGEGEGEQALQGTGSEKGQEGRYAGQEEATSREQVAQMDRLGIISGKGAEGASDERLVQEMIGRNGKNAPEDGGKVGERPDKEARRGREVEGLVSRRVEESPSVGVLEGVQQLLSEKLEEVDIDKGMKAVGTAVQQVEGLVREAVGSGEARAFGKALVEGQGLGWDTEAMAPGGPDGQVAAGGAAAEVAEDTTAEMSSAEDELERARQMAVERAARAEEAAARFEHNFMHLLETARFECLSARDLQLTAALNSDYLLTLPIDVDWRRASSANALLFRRGYTTEFEEGLMLGAKLDYLQSAALLALFRVLTGTLLQPTQRSVQRWRELAGNQPWVESIRHWLFEPLRPGTANRVPAPLLRKETANGSEVQSLEGGRSRPMGSKKVQEGQEAELGGLPIWEAARRAVPRYEAVLSSAGSRGMLLRRLLVLTGLLPPPPAEDRAFPLALPQEDRPVEAHLRPRYVARIAMRDIWQPASQEVAGRSPWRRLRAAVSVFFSRSKLKEPAFEELVLLYKKTDLEQEDETNGQGRLQLQAFEKIPIPDLKVVFPDKKLRFRVLDTVRLDLTTVAGLAAFLINYRFEDFLSSPSAFALDVITTASLALFILRALLSYKRTWDRYQLLVNQTLYEKTLASGFRTVHFLVDASQEQQFKEAALAYGVLLRAGGPMTVAELQTACERLLYAHFLAQVEMPIEKAVDTLVRLGLASLQPEAGPEGSTNQEAAASSGAWKTPVARLGEGAEEDNGTLPVDTQGNDDNESSRGEAVRPQLEASELDFTCDVIGTAAVEAAARLSGTCGEPSGETRGTKKDGRCTLRDHRKSENNQEVGGRGEEDEEEDLAEPAESSWRVEVSGQTIVAIEPSDSRQRLQARWMELIEQTPAWASF